jgi:hypothetical protein
MRSSALYGNTRIDTEAESNMKVIVALLGVLGVPTDNVEIGKYIVQTGADKAGAAATKVGADPRQIKTVFKIWEIIMAAKAITEAQAAKMSRSMNAEGFYMYGYGDWMATAPVSWKANETATISEESCPCDGPVAHPWTCRQWEEQYRAQKK